MKLIPNRKLANKFLLFLLILLSKSVLYSENPGFLYAEIERTSEDSVYVAIHNDSQDTVCLFTGYIHSRASQSKYSKVDMMLYLHRYVTELGQYKLSFVPLKPFIQYTSHMPVSKIGYEDEPNWPLTYEFALIAPHDMFIYPISIASILKKEYIEDFHPENFPFYNILAIEKGNQTYLGKHAEYKPYINKLKISRAPDRDKDWIIIEFAIYTQWNLMVNPYSFIGGPSSKWENFYLHPKECNSQVMNYITVSLPINISNQSHSEKTVL